MTHTFTNFTILKEYLPMCGEGSFVASAFHSVTLFKVGKMQQKPNQGCDLQKSSFEITEEEKFFLLQSDN